MSDLVLDRCAFVNPNAPKIGRGLLEGVQRAWENLFIDMVFECNPAAWSVFAGYFPEVNDYQNPNGSFRTYPGSCRDIVSTWKFSRLNTAQVIQWLVDNHQAWFDREIPDFDKLIQTLQDYERNLIEQYKLAEEYADPIALQSAAAENRCYLEGAWDLHGGWRRNPPKEFEEE